MKYHEIKQKSILEKKKAEQQTITAYIRMYINVNVNVISYDL